MAIEPPNDELDERWKAMHEHPELAQVKGFDSLDLGEKSHLHDADAASAETMQRPAVKKRRRPSDDDVTFPTETQGAGIYDDGPHPEDVQIGHDMLHEEFQNWMNKPTVIDIEDDPL